MIGTLDRDTYNMIVGSQMKQGNNWGCGVILYKPSTNEILIGERTDTHNFCTPGGKVEIGETVLNGVVRECFEESHLVLKSVQFIGYRVHSSENGKNWVSFMFLSTDFEGDIIPQESEIVSWNWVKLEDAMMMNLFEPTKKSLEVAIAKKAMTVGAELEYGVMTSGIVEEQMNGDGNGDWYELPIFDEMPRLSDLYRNGRPDRDVCSYSYCDDSMPW
jgi:8-oxo-dGTP pyrophosphatase MutT (NUDIX family)